VTDGLTVVLLILTSLGISISVARLALLEVLRVARIVPPRRPPAHL
jgi:hypothetical protein